VVGDGGVRRFSLVIGLLVVCLGGAQLARPESEPERALRERAQAFWEARVKEDFASQYSYLEPKVRRQLSLADYIKQQGPVQYMAARVEGVQVDEARGLVTVRIRVHIRLPRLVELRDQEKVFQEEWVRRGGEWYRLLPQG
jgi:hypothetical protein